MQFIYNKGQNNFIITPKKLNQCLLGDLVYYFLRDPQEEHFKKEMLNTLETIT